MTTKAKKEIYYSFSISKDVTGRRDKKSLQNTGL